MQIRLLLCLMLALARPSFAHWELVSDPPTEFCVGVQTAGAGTIAAAVADGYLGGSVRALGHGGAFNSHGASAMCAATDSIRFKWNTEDKPRNYPKKGKVNCEATVDASGAMFLGSPSANYSLSLATRFRCPFFTVKAKLDEKGHYTDLPSASVTIGPVPNGPPIGLKLPLPGPGVRFVDYFGPECDADTNEDCLTEWFEETRTSAQVFVWAAWGWFRPGQIEVYADSIMTSSSNLLPCDQEG